MGSQSEILFHEILDVQKILVGWTTFFFLVLKIGRTSKKNTLYFVWSDYWMRNWKEKIAKRGTELIFTVHLSNWYWSFLVFLATRDKRTRESFQTLMIHLSHLQMSDPFMFPSKWCHFVICLDKRYVWSSAAISVRAPCAICGSTFQTHLKWACFQENYASAVDPNLKKKYKINVSSFGLYKSHSWMSHVLP